MGEPSVAQHVKSLSLYIYIYTCILFYFIFLCIFRAVPAAYGGSQARRPIGDVAAGLRQSHSNAGSEPCLQPTPQLTEAPDPQST